MPFPIVLVLQADLVVCEMETDRYIAGTGMFNSIVQ